MSRVAPETEFETAVRSLQEARSAAINEMSQLFGIELDRYRDVWRQTFDSVKVKLAELERTCDTSVGKSPAEATGALSSIIERLVTAATTATEAAAQRARAESRAETANVRKTLTEVEAELQRARDELERQRDELRAVVDSLTKEQTAATRAESALQETQKQLKQTVSSYESQMQALRKELWGMQQQVEGERATRAKLVNAIRQAVDVDAPVAAVAAVVERVDFKPEKDTVQPVAEVPAPPAAESTEAEDAKSDPALVSYVQHLLDTAESLYNADVTAKRSTTDLVDRLTDHLRSARLLFLQRTGIANDRREPTLFDQLLTQRLNTAEDTAFGRHLGIAAHACLSERARS